MHGRGLSGDNILRLDIYLQTLKIVLYLGEAYEYEFMY